jgi:hypothetical protein
VTRETLGTPFPLKLGANPQRAALAMNRGLLALRRRDFQGCNGIHRIVLTIIKEMRRLGDGVVNQ